MIVIIFFLCIAIKCNLCPADQFLYNTMCINISCTNNYIPRFMLIQTADGERRRNIAFDGEIAILKNNNLQVSVRFNDIQGDGTMKMDNPQSCLEQVLLNHNYNFQNYGNIDNSVITSSFNEYIGIRQWQFEVAPADWGTKFTKDISVPGKIVYKGYYSYQFKVAGILQVQYYFSFELVVSTDTNVTIDTSFAGVIDTNTSIDSDCKPRVQSTLQFCSDSTCLSQSNTMHLYLNQRFWMIQKITSPEFTTFGIDEPIVQLQGNGLLKVITPVSQVNSPGQMILELSVEFVYNQVYVRVGSKVTAPNRRLLNQNQKLLSPIPPSSVANIFSVSDNIDCIAPSEGAACATDVEVCIKNGWVDVCNPESLQNALIVSVIAVLLLTL